MKAILSLCLIFLMNGLSAQTTYSTVADGNWNSASTWMDGMIPSTTIQNSTKVIITHNVIYNRSNDLDVKKGSLKILEGSLTFPQTGTGSGRSIYVRHQGKLTVNSGSLIMPLTNSSGGNCSGNMNNNGGKITFNSANIEVAQNFVSEDADNTFILSCIKVGENYDGEDSKDIYDRSCIEIGSQGSGNYENDGGEIKVNQASVLLRGTSGNFKNKNSSSKIKKYMSATIGFSAIDVPGDLENNGSWDAPVDKYCVADDVQGSRAWDIDFTSPENCGVVNTTNCNCTTTPSLQSAPTPGFVYERGVCELPEICAMPTNYFFDSTIGGVNIPWLDVNGNGSANLNVTIGNYNYSEAQGRAIYNTPNPNGNMPHSKKGFLAIATLRLSKTNYAQDPILLAAVNTIDLWLMTRGKLSPTNLPSNNQAVSAAADVINQWIIINRCPDRR